MGLRWRLVLVVLLVVGVLGGLYLWQLRPAERSIEQRRSIGLPELLERHCEDVVGEPRIERIGDRVFVAIGYDLANVILVRTDEGNVIIDAGMSPARMAPAKRALEALAPGPVRALVYTHSHIDHVGGASVWLDDQTEIWATERFQDHFLKQYGIFRDAEQRRGRRQFGFHVSPERLPCSALGRQVDLEAAIETGARLPTRTFSGQTSFEVGGIRFELHEAHGETDDQLFVWVPALGVLMPGDNYYRAFPNLYTIRGTRPRPVKTWIESLDRMRALSPRWLVPSHTTPIEGEEAVRRALMRYRDGIQWVRDQVVKGANAGLSVDDIVASTGLPPGLADEPALYELYGQVDWSARAIYGNELGWFDGEAADLYPLTPAQLAGQSVALMGGSEGVESAAREALAQGEHRWALHLLALLRKVAEQPSRLDVLEAETLEGLAATLSNSNGRGYLLARALELRGSKAVLPAVKPDAELLDAVPLEVLFEVMASRLIPERAVDVHEHVAFAFEPEGRRFHLTVRNGIVEVVEGDPLPGTPPAVAVLHTDAASWRRLAINALSPAAALASGALRIEGDATAFLRFVQRFRRGF